MEAENINNSTNGQRNNTQQAGQDINYDLSFVDNVAISIDQPMGIGTFIAKNVIQGSVTALCTVAAFKAGDWLKARKDRKFQVVSNQNGPRVAGE